MPELAQLLRGLALAVVISVGTPSAFADDPAEAVWIDVRTPAEYADGHLAGAHSIPFDGIEKGVTRLRLDKDQVIYLYCAVGGRAEVARQRLQAIGYTRVINAGGLEAARATQAAQR